MGIFIVHGRCLLSGVSQDVEVESGGSFWVALWCSGNFRRVASAKP